MGPLILGESVRVVDERFRVSIPPELVEMLAVVRGECILAKERPGCLSLWNASDWKDRLASEIAILEQKVVSRRLDTRLVDVQRLGRMLSTRHRPVTLAGRGRLAIPEGFREFLEIEPGGELVVVGAALCIELWQPVQWRTHVGEEMPEFRKLLDALIGN